MKKSLVALLLAVVGLSGARADVLYSFSELPYPLDAQYPIDPAIKFTFTTPTLLTSPTTIQAADLQAPLIYFAQDYMSINSVMIDPGVNGQDPTYPGTQGVPLVIIQAGRGGQNIYSEGDCFDANSSCYSTLLPEGAQPFDHFGSYSDHGANMTISFIEPPATATPEPRFEAIVGTLLLVGLVGIARRP